MEERLLQSFTDAGFTVKSSEGGVCRLVLDTHVIVCGDHADDIAEVFATVSEDRITFVYESSLLRYFLRNGRRTTAQLAEFLEAFSEDRAIQLFFDGRKICAETEHDEWLDVMEISDAFIRLAVYLDGWLKQ